MKILATAIALTFALPAAAQTAPVPQAQQYQDHAQHGQMQHGQMQHGQPQPGQSGQHDGHAAMGDCCADRNGNGRMDCCEGMEQGDRRDSAQQPAPQPQAHQSH